MIVGILYDSVKIEKSANGCSAMAELKNFLLKLLAYKFRCREDKKNFWLGTLVAKTYRSENKNNSDKG